MSIQRKTSFIRCGSLDAVTFMLRYTKMSRKEHIEGIDLHHHKELEIYLNLAGDISFLVENNLYPLERGDIIISRPGEFHHSVYRSDRDHELFLFFFDLESSPWLNRFFHEDVTANFISPDDASKKTIIHLCETLLEENISELDKFYCLFSLLRLLKQNAADTPSDLFNIPEDLTDMLTYISRHVNGNLKVSDLANAFFLSESTIKRRFQEYLNTTPVKFIQKRKMAYAAGLLEKGETVLAAGINAGYADNSYFIRLFRRYYGVSPFQYKRIHQKNGIIPPPTQ